MSPSPGQTLRAAFLRLTRLLGLAFACIVAGALAGPWSTPAAPQGADAQVLAAPTHELPAGERQEEPLPARNPTEETEDDEETVIAAATAHPPHPLRSRDAARSHDALGPPTRALDVETPPPRA
jgi:hypothetical protein